ncbi:MAG: hypothetical protein P8Y91_01980 [Desulfuromonadales bacterium]|jgi:hypothetical protein
MIKTTILQCDAHQAWIFQTINKLFLVITLGVSILLVSVCGHAADVPKEQIKGLDEQVQEIKSDVLAIAAELNHLEEKLLYPSNSQVAVFVSLKADDDFLLDALELQLDGEAVAYHLYSYKELQAFAKGGVQRVYTGNLPSGRHEIEITMLGKSKGGSDFSRSERFSIDKAVGPKAVEITLSNPGLGNAAIELKEL